MPSYRKVFFRGDEDEKCLIGAIVNNKFFKCFYIKRLPWISRKRSEIKKAIRNLISSSKHKDVNIVIDKEEQSPHPEFGFINRLLLKTLTTSSETKRAALFIKNDIQELIDHLFSFHVCLLRLKENGDTGSTHLSNCLFDYSDSLVENIKSMACAANQLGVSDFSKSIEDYENEIKALLFRLEFIKVKNEI